jgi:opacity protein-like surface antigen
MKKIVVGLVLLVFPLLSFAQGIELTPFVGYRWGGEIVAGQSNLFSYDVKVDDSAAFGLLLGVPIAWGLDLELMVDRQQTSFKTDRGLFEPSLEIADVDVTYYHIGLLWQWETPNIRPFVVISAGVTNLDLDLPNVGTETKFSGSFGGGVKVPISRNLGLRLEGRGFWTSLGRRGGNSWCRTCDWYYDYDDDLYQGEARLGLTVTF